MSDEVGSMDVVMNYRDGGFKAGLAQAKAWLMETQQSSKSVKVEMTRLGAAAAATAVYIAKLGRKLKDMMTTALADSPYLLGAITRMKTSFQLLGWGITSVLKPIFDWLADKLGDLYDWFTNLNPIIQDFISWITILGTAAAISATGILSLALGLKALGFGGMLAAISTFVGWVAGIGTGFVTSIAGVVAFGVAIGTALGILGVWVLDELGILDWIADMGQGFRDWSDSGNLLADALTLLRAPFVAFGDLILVLVTNKTMEDFWKDMDRVTASAIRMKEALGFGREVANLPTRAVIGSYATGTLAVPSTGLYKLHAGETVSPASTSGIRGTSGGSTNIVVDFGNAVINLASGIDLENLADTISNRIAERQAWESF